MKKKQRIPGKITGNAIWHFFQKPATIDYPKHKIRLSPGYRGKLVYDASACIGCNLCVRDCPAGAIQIVNIGTQDDKHFELILDLDHCIFCGQCADSCNKHCISLSSDVELGSLTKQDLKQLRL